MTATHPLPAWLAEQIPAVRPVIIIAYNATQELFTLTYPDSSPLTFETFDDAYETAYENDAYDVDADISLQQHGFIEGLMTPDETQTPEQQWADIKTWAMAAQPEADGSKQAYFFLRDPELLRVIQEAYDEFQERHQQYLQNPKDFFNAYHWLDTHPASWVKHPIGDEKEHPEQPTFHWIHEGLVGKISMWVTKDEETSKPAIFLETGGHTPNLLERYGDDRLEVRAPTYEEAIVLLAHKFNMIFASDGTERGD